MDDLLLLLQEYHPCVHRVLLCLLQWILRVDLLRRLAAYALQCAMDIMALSLRLHFGVRRQ